MTVEFNAGQAFQAMIDGMAVGLGRNSEPRHDTPWARAAFLFGEEIGQAVARQMDEGARDGQS